MAGMDAAEAPQPKKKGEFGLRRAKRRVGIRIDMTPMVDVAFLLLIFFMVTTVFRRPLAMEVNMPEPDAKVEVPESNVLTLFVSKDNSMAYKIGKNPLAPIEWASLLPTFKEGVQVNPDLIILVKVHREAKYEIMVDMMDLLEDAKMERFSVIPMKEDDLKLLEGATP